ncbi:MAG: hypothetical protein WDW38_003731 [Sanguina aurantia]
MCTEEDAEQLDSIRTCHRSLHIRTRIHGIDASVDFTQQMLAFLRCPPAVQQKVMLMFCPNAELSRGHHGFVQAVEEYELQLLRLGRSFGSIAQQAECALLLPLLAAVRDMNECSRVSVAPILLRWMCNAHALNTGGIGLFEQGSLVTHSCDGNLRYSCRASDAGTSLASFHATLPITAGTVLTSSYLGGDENVMLSIRQRQKILWGTKLFQCTCSRCLSSSDPYRSIPCPACGSSSKNSDSNSSVTGSGSSIVPSIQSYLLSPDTANGNLRTDHGSDADSISSDFAQTGLSQARSHHIPGGFCNLRLPATAGDDRIRSSSTPRNDPPSPASPDQEQNAQRAAVSISSGGTESAMRWCCDSCSASYSQEGMATILATAAALLPPSSQPAMSTSRGRSPHHGKGERTDIEADLEHEVYSASEQINCYGRSVNAADLLQLQKRCHLLLGDRHCGDSCSGGSSSSGGSGRQLKKKLSVQRRQQMLQQQKLQQQLQQQKLHWQPKQQQVQWQGAGAAAPARGTGARNEGFSWESGPATLPSAWTVLAESPAGPEPAPTGPALGSHAAPGAAAPARATKQLSQPAPAAVAAATPGFAAALSEAPPLSWGGVDRHRVLPVSTRAADGMPLAAVGQPGALAAAQPWKLHTAGGVEATGHSCGAGATLLHTEIDNGPDMDTSCKSSARKAGSSELKVFSNVALDVVYEVAVAFSELSFQFSCFFSDAVRNEFLIPPAPDPKPTGEPPTWEELVASTATDHGGDGSECGVRCSSSCSHCHPDQTTSPAAPLAESATTSSSSSQHHMSNTAPSSHDTTATCPAASAATAATTTAATAVTTTAATAVTTTAATAATTTAATAVTTTAATEPNPVATTPTGTLMACVNVGDTSVEGADAGADIATRSSTIVLHSTATAAAASRESPAAVDEIAATRAAALGRKRSGQRRECDRTATAICSQLQATWEFLDQHTPDEPELVLKACAGPAATALLEAAELELLSRPEPWLQAVRTAEHIASKLGIFYHRHPYHDLDGAVTQLEGVLHTFVQGGGHSLQQLCPGIRHPVLKPKPPGQQLSHTVHQELPPPGAWQHGGPT